MNAYMLNEVWHVMLVFLPPVGARDSNVCDKNACACLRREARITNAQKTINQSSQKTTCVSFIIERVRFLCYLEIIWLWWVTATVLETVTSGYMLHARNRFEYDPDCNKIVSTFTHEWLINSAENINALRVKLFLLMVA